MSFAAEKRADAWDEMVRKFRPNHFLTLTTPDVLFLIDDGDRKILPPVSERKDIFIDVVRQYITTLARMSKQHIRFIYEVEMKEDRTIQSPHIHGHLKWELSPIFLQNAVENKYTIDGHGDTYRCAHYTRASSVRKDRLIGSWKRFKPNFAPEAALDIVWKDYLLEKHKVWVPYQPEGFREWDNQLSGGGYTFEKHGDGDDGGLIIDACPRHQAKCNKKGRVCAHKWEE